jgi:hypothetical protein
VSVSMRADGSHAWEARHQQDPSTFSRRCDCDAPRDAQRATDLDEALVPCGLRSTQRSVLDSIARAGRPTMGELAASLVLDRSALAYNIKPLE